MAKNTKGKAKQTKTFLKKGLLDGQIKARHKARDFKQKVKARAVTRNKGKKPAHNQEEEEVDEVDLPAKNSDEEEDSELDLDAVLGAEGLDEGSDLEDDDLDDLAGDASDDESLSNEQHMKELKALAETDPEFYKYLQENDKALLDFDGTSKEDVEMQDDSEDEDNVPMDMPEAAAQTIVLTKEMLKTWQQSLLEKRSLKALRALLLAFRSATGTANRQYDIPTSALFNKLVMTTLKYVPVVLIHHVPYKEREGKFKINTGSKQYATVQRVIKSFFVSLQSLLISLPKASDIPAVAISESSKLVPYLVGNRKTAKGWTKMLLDLFDTASDETRLAAFLGLRRLAIAGDHNIRESVVKGVYVTFLASAKQTSIYTLPSLNLTKNAASEMFLLPGKNEGEQLYQLAFSYIRQLAILLRKGVKEGSKNSFKAVYNWQFVHAIDFWSIVLCAASDKEWAIKNGTSSLPQLIYPLVQLGLGAIRLVPTSRYYPLRFHLVRSLLRIIQRTGTFIPLATSLFETLDSSELSKKSKPSTLKPLDLEYYIKCPTAYLKTRVYADGIAEELVYLLTEFYASVSTSIAFPEIAIPATVTLRRHAKKSHQPKLVSQLKVLVEKIESNAKWLEEKRSKVEFAPQKRDQVDRFLKDETTSPLLTYLKLQRKIRDQKRETLERAAREDNEGEDEE